MEDWILVSLISKVGGLIVMVLTKQGPNLSHNQIVKGEIELFDTEQ